MNNEVDNVTIPFFEFNGFTSGSKINVTFFFVCWLVYEINQFVQLAAIQLNIQHSSKYLFSFLIICLGFVITDGATIFEGM